MDDSPVTRNEGLRLGPGASLAVLGLLAGLAIGWLLWRSSPGDPGPGSAEALPGPGAEASVEGVSIAHDPVLGPGDARITIVEFSDFECPFCTRFAQDTAPLLRRQYADDVRWVFVNNPLQAIHPRAYDLALAGECAHEQDRFWPFYDAMFSDRYGTTEGGVANAARDIGVDTARFEACYRNADHAGEVAADLKEAQKFYILGTPTFFVNGRRLEGALPAETFAMVIDSILATPN
ncbi:MAG TPA: thioredoxin domain-containing protein [Gemmatimonadota bacterium]|nr:thioredoxin domain-containing protein [Gemmatimonadota bacterium]